MRRFPIALVAALCLTGCVPTLASVVETVGQPPGTGAAAVVDVAADKVILEGTRSLIIASNAYQGAAAALTPLVGTGVFTRAQLDTIDKLNVQAFTLLQTADGGLTKAQRAAGVFDIVAQLDALRSHDDELTR